MPNISRGYCLLLIYFQFFIYKMGSTVLETFENLKIHIPSCKENYLYLSNFLLILVAKSYSIMSHNLVDFLLVDFLICYHFHHYFKQYFL